MLVPGAYEPPKVAKERTSASYWKVNRATAFVMFDSVMVIARVQNGLTVNIMFGSF